jgi:uncharacterized membrane protein YkoI
MMAAPTERPAAGARWRPSRRTRAAAVLAVTVAAAIAVTVATWPREDDQMVDPTTPEARRAVAVAQEVVPGRVVGVARDIDNGKWEVTIVQEGREYEVELAPQDLTLLRLDYD